MKKIVQKFLITIISFLLLVIVFDAQPVFADGEKINFGSEQYDWDVRSNGAYPLAVAAAADSELEYVSFDVTYEQSMLEFVSGGELVEKGRVHVELGDITGTGIQELIKFTPKAAGHTSAVIRNAVVRVKGGQDVKLDPLRVQIIIAVPEDCKLSGIQINGKDIGGFSPDEMEYSLVVKYDVSEIDVSATPSDIPITVTATDLKVGSNRIGVYASNEYGEKARYVLKINRMNQEDDISQQTQNQEESISDQIREHPLWITAAGMLVAVFLSLLIMKMNMIRRRNRVKQQEARRREGKMAATCQ